MRISAIRIGRLVTGPGYNNHRAEIEVSLDPGDDYDEAVVMARNAVQAELHATREIDRIRESLHELQSAVREAERRLESLHIKIDAGRAIIRSNERIRRLAEAAGIAWNDAGPDLPLVQQPAPETPEGPDVTALHTSGCVTLVPATLEAQPRNEGEPIMSDEQRREFDGEMPF